MNAPRVLLVDDEYASAEVLALILAGDGYHVTTVPDGQQALARLEEAAPDLVIMDFMMPGMNGAHLVNAIRDIQRFEHVPVLMISGAPEAALRRYETQYEAFLRKPFGLEQFLRTVRSLRGEPEDESGFVSL
jgi:CheY-like chemotaxis protein